MPRQRKDIMDRRVSVWYVRVTPKEQEIIDEALRVRYGDPDGMRSRFIRWAVLTAAKLLLKNERSKNERRG